jgi:hypothetical protein
VCGFDSRAIQVCGFIKDLKVKLASCLDISMLMADIIAIDVLDVRDMILYRKWYATLGGNLLMDLFYDTIPTPDVKPLILYWGPILKYQVEYPKEPINQTSNIGREFGNHHTFTNSMKPIQYHS